MEKLIDKKIINYFLQNHVMSLALNTPEGLWAVNLFYIYNNNILSFMSQESSYHAEIFIENMDISGTVSSQESNVIKLKGIQFRGKLHFGTPKENSNIYYKKFPYAKLVTGNFYSIEPQYIKFTDNTLGFGKKLIYKLSNR